MIESTFLDRPRSASTHSSCELHSQKCRDVVILIGPVLFLTFIQKPAVVDVEALNAKNSFLFSDEYLRPALEDDPLLRECRVFRIDHS